MSDDTGLAEALLGLEGFLVLGVGAYSEQTGRFPQIQVFCLLGEAL